VALREAGFRVAAVGNQPASADSALRQLGLPVDLLATSGAWGVQKPDPAFFARVASEMAMDPCDIAYVGDRVDNDVRPAAAAGMVAIFVRRGPWGWIQAGDADPPEATISVADLASLPEALARL
jgi:FMN phosphatase YigB (HAD superfamily)